MSKLIKPTLRFVRRDRKVGAGLDSVICWIYAIFYIMSVQPNIYYSAENLIYTFKWFYITIFVMPCQQKNGYSYIKIHENLESNPS